MGVMGMPPDLPGRHSTTPPRVTGGNLALKELVTGTTLFLPSEGAGACSRWGMVTADRATGMFRVTRSSVRWSGWS